jgi:hypothetical protein
MKNPGASSTPDPQKILGDENPLLPVASIHNEALFGSLV